MLNVRCVVWQNKKQGLLKKLWATITRDLPNEPNNNCNIVN
jgi:hypothetical protein